MPEVIHLDNEPKVTQIHDLTKLQDEGEDDDDIIMTESNVTTEVINDIDGDREDQAQEDENSTIDAQTQENYAIWKSNSIQLYEYLNTVNAIWPSMTVQFLPDLELSSDGDRARYRVLSGTFTSGFKTEVLKIGSFQVQNSERQVTDRVKFDHELTEFQNIQSISGKYETVQEINHSDLEILKLRYLPHNPNLIASITNTGNIYIFDKSKYPSQCSTDFKYEMKLSGHTQEGYGLSWNCQKEGHLLSSASDGKIIHWDITKHLEPSQIKPVKTYASDKEGVNDVLWVPSHDSMFGSVGEDNQLKIYDTRQQTNDPIIKTPQTEHQGGINTLSINYQNSLCVATGDSEGTVNIWDIRNPDSCSTAISKAQSGAITSLKFNPSMPSLLLSSSSSDSVVNIYDLSKENEQERCIFKHGGHLLGVNDVDWNPNDPWMVGSVSYDNTIQFWKPSLDLFV
ncbi:hypothetical protein WICPIJ_001369 [Wickerhamomyces pijperi]|uniref:Histone-binding protein RBBP4-like N-terminal domain-containing protein n=1 Tax=Wickerhamomyces pijperi TaxID=599730 RepID=A0A9P8QBR3_WICPI|nr:hypothetical protein WICPIJ_001369 [Wickerhamomyces pijperi]